MNAPFFQMQNVDMLRHLLWLLPLLGGLYLYARSRKAQSLAAFAGQNDPALFRTDRLNGRAGWKAFIMMFAATLVVVALARPAWNPQPVTQKQRGREVVFLLDVSRSMLAEDMRPSRLERAKLAIDDCLNRIRGDRAGLVVFAGSAQTLCPLTVDYSFLRLALENAGPQSVDRGGTTLCDAIRKASALLENATTANKDIILITDGGKDEFDTDLTTTQFALQAGREAGERKIRIIAIGLGDEKNGQRIPLTGRDGKRYFLTHQGKEVWTTLNASLLRQIAAASHDGKYINAGTGDFDLGALYHALVDSAVKSDLQERKMMRYDEKFQLFLAAALLLVLLEPIVRERVRAR